MPYNLSDKDVRKIVRSCCEGHCSFPDCGCELSTGRVAEVVKAAWDAELTTDPCLVKREPGEPMFVLLAGTRALRRQWKNGVIFAQMKSHAEFAQIPPKSAIHRGGARQGCGIPVWRDLTGRIDDPAS